MSRTITTLLAVASLAAQVAIASETKSAPDSRMAVPAHQETNAVRGIAGKVVQMSGNFTLEPGPMPPGRSVTKPLSVPVHCFKGKVVVFEKPDVKHPAFVQKVQSDKDGAFRCILPPGEYTVVAEIDGKLYLNSFTSGERDAFTWSTVTVQKGKWTTFDIRDSSRAVS